MGDYYFFMNLEKLRQAYLEAYKKWADAPRSDRTEYPDNVYHFKDYGFRDKEWYVYVLARDAYWNAVGEEKALELH